ncbi:reverse transcriptase domain, reverse transcriptase zinc-binding domain protein [Tanacetum coccineum]
MGFDIISIVKNCTLLMFVLHMISLSLLGGVESARVIMEALKEFKCTSGLVPSLPKSMTFFCNVSNHVKLAILSIMPFSEGDLPVKYLGVPLISSRLLNKDCKILVDRVKNRIGDWKNKSLSFDALNLDVHNHDAYRWRGLNGSFSDFLVSRAWDAFRPRGNEVPWFKIVWFPHSIPRHSFHLWLVLRNSLKTRSVNGIWDVGNNVDLNLLPMAHNAESWKVRKGRTTGMFLSRFDLLIWGNVQLELGVSVKA